MRLDQSVKRVLILTLCIALLLASVLFADRNRQLTREKDALASKLSDTISDNEQLKRDNKFLKQENSWMELISTYYYKMFYGLWEVSSVLPGGRYYDEERLNQLIGQTIYYDADVVKVNGTVITKKPFYFMAVVPTDQNYNFHNPNHRPDVDSDLIHLENSYFVVMNFSPDDALGKCDVGMLSPVYIKDDETLILDTDFGHCELKRVLHISDYELKIPPL